MRRQEVDFQSSSLNGYLIEINNPTIKTINQLYSSPEFKKLSKVVQQLGGVANTPEFTNLSNVAQQLGRVANTPEFKNLSKAAQQLGGVANIPEFRNLSNATQQLGKTIYRFYNPSAIQSISKITQEISKSMYKDSAVSTLEKILNINQDVIKTTMGVTSTPAYQNMLSSFQESIAVSKIYNEITRNMRNETQVNITTLLGSFQLSELSLEELIENPYEEITSDDINDVLVKNSLYDIINQLRIKVDYSTDLLEDEAIKNEETREKIDELEKEGKKLLTKKDIIFFVIGFLFSPIFQPFQEIYNEWVSQPSTHLIKNIKKEIVKFYDEKESYTNLRIVTRDNLKIKRGIRVDSETIGALRFGDIVEVIGKKRKWTRIRISDYNNEIIDGWVFTRYLEKLN